MGETDGDRTDRREPTAAFLARVLDMLPAAIVVVDPEGGIVYGNTHMIETMSLSLEEGRGRNILEFIHPDDATWAVEAFLALSAEDRDEGTGADEPWATLPLRVVDTLGNTLPIELTGADGLDDEIVGGFIYDVRLAGEQHLLRSVLTGLASGQPVDDMLRLVAEMVAVPPVRVDAVIARTERGRTRIVGVTSPDLAGVLAGLDMRDGPWASATDVPQQLEVSDLTEPFRDALSGAGYADWMHVSTTSPSGTTTYHVVALTPFHHVPATGVLHRLGRATQLVDVIQLRAENDALLERAAKYDALTDLPNRRGLTDGLAAESAAERVVMYVDLDAFKPINDQHGHAGGDVVLRVVAERLKRAVRPGDVVARIGGDEFVVVIEADGVIDADGGLNPSTERVATRILDELALPIDIGGASVEVSASIGVAVAAAGTPLDSLLASADSAMYEVKRDGGRGHRVTVLDAD